MCLPYQLLHVLLVNGVIGVAVQINVPQHIECAGVTFYRRRRMAESPVHIWRRRLGVLNISHTKALSVDIYMCLLLLRLLSTTKPEGSVHCLQTGLPIQKILACLTEDRPHARWMLYLREGYTVCVACQHPAMHIRNHRCFGDGSDANENQILHWQAVGNARCYGTWRKVRQADKCSCPMVHSFIFT
ncbi:hypothetical protein AB205_0050740 [Aquarana catesbeiana]|uniref:SBSPON-like C-terminal domain-containing protein n=1 Tax=Aquarana catesbeiana TaxID=8400 RepID=A0A2G9S8A3_AQUCT|nr:hypothetical protein AB205_0050740 [Aquarana catesbeiana]